MVSGQPQQSSREQDDPESKTSKSKSAAVVLGPEKSFIFRKGLFKIVLNFRHCKVKKTHSYQVWDRRLNPGLDQVEAQ